MRADFIPLFTALFVTVHLAQSEIMHISWPTAPTVPENNRSYLTTGKSCSRWLAPILGPRCALWPATARARSRSPPPKLHRMPNSDLTLPVYVGCRYATIVFRPYSVDDYLLFIVRPARDNLIAEENEEVCAGESGKDRNRRSEQNFLFDQQ
ncbi:hypothetical protein M3Y99_00170400 [Aphelenchoides fujianensis]|nr:hypothetical protein M3Y99_00170400 [Aphelenchoides fujianensis]